jgi:hypothetical protein
MLYVCTYIPKKMSAFERYKMEETDGIIKQLIKRRENIKQIYFRNHTNFVQIPGGRLGGIG